MQLLQLRFPHGWIIVGEVGTYVCAQISDLQTMILGSSLDRYGIAFLGIEREMG